MDRATWDVSYNRYLFALFLSLIFFASSERAAFAQPQNVDDLVSISFSGVRFNRSTGTFDTVARVENVSGTSISAPVRMTVSDIAPASVSLANASGMTLEGLAFVDIPVSDGALDAGEAVTNVVLRFSNPSRTQFIFTSHLLGQTQTAELMISAAAVPPPNDQGWNNTPVTVTFDCSGGIGGVTCPEPVTVETEGGGQEVVGTAMDSAGNSVSSTATLNIDLTPPTIAGRVTPEANASGWHNASPTIAFDASDSLSGILVVSSPVTVTFDGAQLDWSGTAIDLAGNLASTNVRVNVDKAPPVVTITSPLDGTTLRTGPVNLSGTFSDELSGVSQISCNGVPASVVGTGFSCQVPLDEGNNPIAVSAGDLAGNAGGGLINVLLASPPMVSFTSPSNLSRFSESPIEVTGTADADAVSVIVNGVAATLAPGEGASTFSAEIGLREGNNALTAVMTNAVGEVGSASIEVTLDTSDPRVFIESPRDGETVTAASVSVTGRIDDVVVGTVNGDQVEVFVNGIPAEVSNRRFLVADVPLVPGENTITATGTDRAGNSATTSIVVTHDPSPGVAHVRLLSGNNQSARIGSQLLEPLRVGVFDDGGNPVPDRLVIFKITANNGFLSDGVREARSVAVRSDENGEAQARLTVGTYAAVAANKVEASAIGFSGTAVFTATGVPDIADSIRVDGGGNQTGSVSASLPMPFAALVTDAGHNRLANVPVTFTVFAGGGHFGGESIFTTKTDGDGRAVAVLTLGPEPGFDNNRVEATFAGNPGLPIAFLASGRIPGDPAATQISGVVLDNTNLPIEGVTMHVEGTGLSTRTDAEGQFVLGPAPVGHVALVADGSTAEREGSWPHLIYDFTTVAGQNNTIGMPIYLLPLDPHELCVDENHGGVLTPPALPGLSLTVLPGSATFANGSKIGCVGVTQVHADKVPMVPAGGDQSRLFITIQPPGVHFDPPAPLSLPNVDGLAPGEVNELFSFDHDLGQFVSVGTASVSEDGLEVRSDPGVGIVKGGWHYPRRPPPTASCATCRVAVDVLGPDTTSGTSVSSVSAAVDSLPAAVDVRPGEVKVLVGQKILLKGNGYPDPPPGATAHYEWVSRNPSVATVTLKPGTDAETHPSFAVVEGVNEGTAEIQVVYRCRGVVVSHNVSVTVARLVAVEWQAIDSPLDANPNAGGGLRIFPDKQAPTDTVNRRRVRVRARVTPPVEGFQVFFKSFDVDDPSASTPPLDPDVDVGPGNPEADNKGTPPAGLLMTASALTDSSGVATSTFSVTTRPGDNFVVAASGTEAYLSNSFAFSLDIIGGDGLALPTRIAVVTPMLTVWRRLHIELDSMGPVSGGVVVSGTIVDFDPPDTDHVTETLSVVVERPSGDLTDGSPDRDNVSNPGDGRFQNGLLRLGRFGTLTPFTALGVAANGKRTIYLVPGERLLRAPPIFNASKDSSRMSGLVNGIRETTAGWVLSLDVLDSNVRPFDLGAFTSGRIRLGSGATSSDEVGIDSVNHDTMSVTVTVLSLPFQLVDDDQITGDVPEPDTTILDSALARAYVVPVTTIDNTNVPFVENVVPAVKTTGVYDYDTGVDDPDYWTVYVLGAYQGNTLFDQDPDNEIGPMNIAALLGAADDPTLATDTDNFGPCTLPDERFGGAGAGLKIFMEMFNERSVIDPGGTPARFLVHELGHVFGGRHCHGGVMGLNFLETQYPDRTLNRIRSIPYP